MQPLAYSYLRFSHPDQAKGDSLRRQTDLRDAWLARNGVALDTSLTLEDKGVSGYTGEHRDNPDRHALAAFMALVKKGRIVPDSYLIVESLDRLSREDILPALGLLIGLIESGVRIVQLLPVEVVYDRQANPMTLMMAIMELSRGHSESAMKSERVGAAWRQKKRRAAEGGEALTARGPAWLRLAEGRWEVDGPKAEVVRRVYRMAAAGYGLGAITKKLNAERVPTVGRGPHWPRSYVAKLLADRRPVGEYQPYKGRGPKRAPDGAPVPGYYPAILTEEEWFAARAGLAGRRGKAGRAANDRTNIFAGLLRDALDGGALHLSDKGSRGGRQLVSYQAAGGVDGPHSSRFPLPTFEAAVLALLREVDPGSILPRGDGGADKALVLAGRLAEVDGDVERIKARLLERYSEGLADVLERLEAERRRLAGELTEARQEGATPLGVAWGECRSLLDALGAAPDPEEARVRLRAALRRIVEGVWCVFVARGRSRLAAVQVRFTGGAARDFLIYHRTGTGGSVGTRPAAWQACSLPADVGVEGLDLRRKTDARGLAETLAKINLDLLGRAMSGGGSGEPTDARAARARQVMSGAG
jgi:DNA invertase Pin-like site-specific DNA recombinase